MNTSEQGMFEQPHDFIKDAQSFKSQEIRVKLKRMYFVVRPWLHQQRIKRLKPTNTRLKQQFEEFWEPKKTQRGAGREAPRRPLWFFQRPKIVQTGA